MSTPTPEDDSSDANAVSNTAVSAKVTPSQSAHFSIHIEDELIATAAWPKWPGVVLFSAPALMAGYAFGPGGATLDGFLSDGSRFFRGILRLITDNTVIGVVVSLFIVGLGVLLVVAAYAGVASLLNTSKVFFAQNMLIIQTSPIPLFRRRRSYALSDVIRAEARKNGRPDREFDLLEMLLNTQYTLMLHLQGREPEAVLSNLGGEEQTIRVARAINDRIKKAKSDRSEPLERD